MNAQPGFRSSDSCECQLLSRADHIYINLLNVTVFWKLGEHFQTFLKPLAEFGMMG